MALYIRQRCVRCGGCVMPWGEDGGDTCILCARPVNPYVSDLPYIQDGTRLPVYRPPTPVVATTVTADDMRAALVGAR